jgi:hypothetical protein
MVTDCGGLGFWDMSDAETVFLNGAFSLMRIIIPAAICLLIWRIRVTNRTQSVTSLGLDESAYSHPCLSRPRISRGTLLLYATTTFITFQVGLLTFKAYELLREMLSSVAK